MGNQKEDTVQSFGTIFFIGLFLLFLLASSGSKESRTSSSGRNTPQNELVFGEISNHRDAIIFKPASLPDPEKCFESALHNTRLIPFSIPNKLADYNRRTAQNFFIIQKARLKIEPAFPWRLYFHLTSNEDESLPVLS
jgi:hypothetical protein